MRHKKIFLAAAAAVMLIMLSGCGQKIFNYSAEDYVGVEIKGTEGNGTARVAFNRSSFYDKLNRDLFDGNALEEELAALEIVYYNLVKINVEGDTSNLSNGDTLTVSVTADNDKLKEYRIHFTDEKFTYTVSGLEEVKEFDLFEGVSAEFDGISPYVTANVVNESPYAEYVNFFTDSDFHANGDTILIKAAIHNSGSTYFEENNLVPASTEKAVTVEVPEYYAAEAEHDFSAIDSFFKDKMDETLSSGNYSVDWEYSGSAFFKDGEATDKWKVLSCEYTPVKKALVYVNGGYIGWDKVRNDYNCIWKLSFEIENVKKASYSSDYKYDVGDRETAEIYACTHIPNVVVAADGSLTYDPESCKLITYSRSLLANYVGSSLDEIEEARKKDFMGYEHEYIVIS